MLWQRYGSRVWPQHGLQLCRVYPQAQEVTALSWSACSAVLAVGTVKGNLQLYFVKERRKMPVAAKHTKRVCASSWALHEDILAMAALDRTVSDSQCSWPMAHGPGGLAQACWNIPTAAANHGVRSSSCSGHVFAF